MIRSLFIQTAAALFVFGMSTAVDATPDAERWNREFLEAKARKLDFEKRKTKGQTERAASERDRVRILNSRAKAEEVLKRSRYISKIVQNRSTTMWSRSGVRRKIKSIAKKPKSPEVFLSKPGIST
jgi:hypothetical protein